MHRATIELQLQLNQSNDWKAEFEKLKDWYYKTKGDFQTTIDGQKTTNDDQKTMLQTLTKERDDLKVH